MKNAHLRFGWLTYYKTTDKTTTHFKLRLDRFVGEIDPEPPLRAHAHLVSVVGSDTQIAAVSAAIAMDEQFTIEGPNVQPVQAGLGRKAQVHKGSVQFPDRKKPLRHLIGVSQDFMNISTATNATRILAIDASAAFVWSALARLQGLPAVPEWAEWFYRQLEKHQALTSVLGIGCDPVLIRGRKQQFLKWLSRGIERGAIQFPAATGPIHWPEQTLKQVFHPSMN